MKSKNIRDNTPKTTLIQTKESTSKPSMSRSGLENSKENLSFNSKAVEQIRDGVLIEGKSNVQGNKPKTPLELSVIKQNSKENLKPDHLINRFWRKSTSWKKRKKIALTYLRQIMEMNNNSFHCMAYEGKINVIEGENNNCRLIFKDRKNQEISYENFFTKDVFRLTPLIYAIWGEEDRTDETKSTSKSIFSVAQSIYNQRKLQNSDDELTKFDPILKYEMGHVIVHKITTEEDFCMYDLIIDDNYEALMYLIRAEGFKLVRERYDHTVCEDTIISVAAFALRLNSIRCVNLLFENMVKYIKDPQYSYMLSIIKAELPEYISFNSVIIDSLLKGFTNIQEKSFPVNLNKIPVIDMIDCDSQIIDLNAYNNFDKMPDAKDFMKAQIVNSNILFPCVSGSEESLNLIQALSTTENISLFRIPLIKSYLQYKWEKLWFLVFSQSILMWSNIPLFFLLIFVNKFDQNLLIAFTAVNSLLAIFEFFQFSSMELGQYFGNVDQSFAILGLRLLLLLSVFRSNFQPYSCAIYSIATACILTYNSSKMIILYLSLMYSIFIGLIFAGFWIQYEFLDYLMIGSGSFFFILAFVLKFTRMALFCNCCFRVSEAGFMVVILLMAEKNFELFIISQFFIAISMVTQVRLKNRRKLCLVLLLDLIKAAGFTVNFYLDGVLVFYITNSCILMLSLINALNGINDLLEKKTLKEQIIMINSFFSLILIGLDLNDFNRLKIVIVGSEVLLIYFYKRKKLVKIGSILKNLISMLINWNTIDLARIALSAVWILYEFAETTDKALTYALVTLILLRGLTGFRCFKMTRYYVRLILNSTQEILPFILIFFYSTFSFGIICSIYKHIDTIDIWMYPYDLNIGAASHNNTFDMNYISFVIATVINVIIMLNLLISILGDSFDRFQVSAPEIDFLEMAEALSEFETIMFWKRKMNDPGAFLVALLIESKTKKRLGKITREEFFELKDEVVDIKDGLDKQFEFAEKKIVADIEDSEQRIKREIEMMIMNVQKNMHVKMVESDKRILDVLGRMGKR